jgi:hypothetical protein
VPRYTLRLLIALVVCFFVGWILVLFNPDLGLFAVLMLLNVGSAGLLAAYFAVQSVRKKESWCWVGYGYLMLLFIALVWAIIDM